MPNQSFSVAKSSEAEKHISEGLKGLILLHILKFGPDNPWLMTRRLMGNSGWNPKVSEDDLERACAELEQMGLIKRFKGSLKRKPTSSIKPWMKVKQKNADARPKGIYYGLTKQGRAIARTISKDKSNRLILDKFWP